MFAFHPLKLFMVAMGALLFGCTSQQGIQQPVESTRSTELNAPELTLPYEGAVAVLPFAIDAQIGSLDWVPQSIQMFLISSISKLDGITTTSRETIRDVLQEQELTILSGITDSEMVTSRQVV